MHPKRDTEPPTNAEAAAIGCSLATGLGCGLMVFVGGLVLIAVIVLLVL